MTAATQSPVSECLTSDSFLLYFQLSIACRIIEPGGLPPGDLYPTSAPEHEDQWHQLVQVFLTGARAAADLGQAPARLAAEVEPGVTLADELHSVAVHNAYHFGKIGALRQRIGAWPPKASDGSRTGAL